MSDHVPDPRAYLDELDELLHAVLGDDVDLSSPDEITAAADKFEARMEKASQAERDAVGSVLCPVAESVEHVAEGYQQVVDAAQGIADPDPAE